MKKRSTTVTKSDKTNTDNPELHTDQTPTQKMYRDHKTGDYHLHGRVNKFPFGSSHGPACF
jgi:hypothetical protein